MVSPTVAAHAVEGLIGEIQKKFGAKRRATNHTSTVNSPNSRAENGALFFQAGGQTQSA
jgi:hypothetical protein